MNPIAVIKASFVMLCVAVFFAIGIMFPIPTVLVMSAAFGLFLLFIFFMMLYEAFDE